MTTGGTIFFNNQIEKNRCINFLSKFSFRNQKIFFLKHLKKQNKLYFRFNAVLHNLVKKVDVENYNKIEIEGITLKKELINDFNLLLKYLSLIKSTSVHNNEGSLYHSKCFKNYKNIENHKINNLICEYFNCK